MTDLRYQDPLPPLGVGSILSTAASVFLQRFVLFFLIAFSIYVVLVVFNTLFVPTEQMLDPAAAAAAAPTSLLLTYVGSTLVTLVASSLITGIIVLGAYDALQGNAARPAAYVGAAIAVIVPLIVLSVLVNVLFFFGLTLFIVPGLYIAALWSVVVPAIVVESAGFGALGRSRTLTKNYRWSIVGLLVLVLLITAAVSLLQSLVIAPLFGVNAFAPTPDAVPIITGFPYQIVGAIAGAIPAAFTGVVTAVLFARLKEIKEGVGTAELTQVFE